MVDVPLLSDFFKDLYSGAKSLVTDIGEGAPLGAEVSVPQAQQSFLGIKRMAVEGYFAELRGEKPASWATQNPLLIGDASILAMTQSNELERYQSDSQYQKRIKEEAIKFVQENQKEYDRFARKIEKAYKDADVSLERQQWLRGFAKV